MKLFYKISIKELSKRYTLICLLPSICFELDRQLAEYEFGEEYTLYFEWLIFQFEIGIELNRHDN